MEQSGAAGKGKAVEQGDCKCCEKRDITCMPLTEDKVTNCHGGRRNKCAW